MKPTSSMFRGTNGKNYLLPFVLVTTLFFLWGLCNGMIDVFNKHFQDSLKISKFESFLVQSANFGGYFFMAIPSGLLAARFGYKSGILIGLGLVATGALLFIPATMIGAYAAFLTALFILACGLAVLETIANPYTTVLGSPNMSATRINLAQSFNAVGTTIGPIVGGYFLLSSTSEANTSNNAVYIPYLFVAGLVLVLFVMFLFCELPDITPEDEVIEGATVGDNAPASGSGKGLFRWHFILAIGAQFFYVAAQIGIWAYFINYLRGPDMPIIPADWSSWLYTKWIYKDTAGDFYHLSDFGASQALSVAFLFFLAGRICGSALLSFTRAHQTLAVYGAINTVLMLVIIFHQGWLSVAALFLSNFFMSIMYPTIFSLGIRGLGEHTKFASSLIVMAILGGAILPPVMGLLADHFSVRTAFAMPLICFIYVALYAAFWQVLERIDSGHEIAD